MKNKLNKTMAEIVRSIEHNSSVEKYDLGVGKRYLSAAKKLQGMGAATYEITNQGFIIVRLKK